LPYQVRVYSRLAAGSATPLHDGTDSASNPPRYVRAFLADVDGGATVYFGKSDLTGAANGLAVEDGCELRANAPLSRGQSGDYDLTQIYYMGGAFKLVIDEESR
jgi:hypothetical protein